jgi:hypothetical protein
MTCVEITDPPRPDPVVAVQIIERRQLRAGCAMLASW